MDKKIIIAVIALLAIVGVLVFFVLSMLPKEPAYSLPYCKNPIELHYTIASDYVNDNYPGNKVNLESARPFGPCNSGNTQGTRFYVLDGEETVGVVSVDWNNEVIYKSTLDYQCMIGKECEAWCENKTEGIINDTQGKSKSLWNASEAPCCCNIINWAYG